MLQDSPAERAAERLAQETSTWKSIEIVVRTDIDHQGPPPPQVNLAKSVVHHYIEMVPGRRWLDETMQLQDGTTRTITFYADGDRAADVRPVNDAFNVVRTVNIKRAFFLEDQSGTRNLPAPLTFDFNGMQPLHEALAEATYLGRDSVVGRECDQFVLQRRRTFSPGLAVYSLDLATGRPLKVVEFATEEARAQGRPNFIWEALSFDRVGDRHIPLKSRSAFYTEQAPTKPMNPRTFTVETIHFDRDYPETMFWPTIGPEDLVHDLVRNTITAASVTREIAHKPTQAQGPPLTAEPESSWLGVLPGVSVALGLALLIVGATLAWRRR